MMKKRIIVQKTANKSVRIINNKTLRVIVLSTIILLLLTLTSCKQKSAFDTDYRQGRDGLVISLTPGSPPSEVYEDDIIPILFTIKNKGAYDVNFGNIYLSIKGDRAYLMYDPQIDLNKNLEAYFKNEENDGFKDLHGKSYYFPDGEEALITTAAQAKKIGPFSHIKTPLTIEACYPYETFFSTPVCIDTNPLTIAQRKEVCEVKPVMTFRDQGAPLAVTKVEYKQRFSRSLGVGSTDKAIKTITPSFRITISNVGKGVVVTAPPDDYSRQSNNNVNLDSGTEAIVNTFVGQEAANIVKNENTIRSNVLSDKVRSLCELKDVPVSEVGRFSIIAFLGTKQLTCEPEKPYLKGNSVTVNCYMPPGDFEYKTYNYLDELQIKLDYIYRNAVTKEIIIDKGSTDNYDNYELTDQQDVLINGVTLCEYCSLHPSDNKCKNLPEKSRKMMEKGVFFSCNCGRTECYEKSRTGECIVGSSWCPGTNYCCATMPSDEENTN